MKASFKRIILIALAALLMASAAGCYPIRIARNPNPTQDPKDAFVTEAPTDEPVITDAPTEAPTDEPVITDGPTEAPTEGPEETEPPVDTDEPTEAPTEGPTPAPTPSPTATPTPAPTPAPTPEPTPTPSSEYQFSTVDILTGASVNESIFSRSKLTVVNVWATWCGPCIEELPSLKQLAGEYSGRAQIITILYDSGDSGAAQTAQGICAGMGFTLPVLARNNSVKAAFDSPYLTPPTLPTTFFIDRNGHLLTVVKNSHSIDEWRSLINYALGLAG